MHNFTPKPPVVELFHASQVSQYHPLRRLRRHRHRVVGAPRTRPDQSERAYSQPVIETGSVEHRTVFQPVRLNTHHVKLRRDRERKKYTELSEGSWKEPNSAVPAKSHILTQPKPSANPSTDVSNGNKSRMESHFRHRCCFYYTYSAFWYKALG